MLHRIYQAHSTSADAWVATSLSSLLGELLLHSVRGRTNVAPLLGLPGTGPLRVARNELLFRDDVCLGRADLRVDARVDGALCTALVTVRFGARVDPALVDTHREAVPNSVVTVVSANDADAEPIAAAGGRHVRWRALAASLALVGDTRSEELLTLLAEAGYGARGPSYA
ncbi:MAG: hypothetical protein R3F59_17905 [Myxococcota bacterium]